MSLFIHQGKKRLTTYQSLSSEWNDMEWNDMEKQQQTNNGAIHET